MNPDYTTHINRLLVECGIPYTFVSNLLRACYVSHPKRKLYIPNPDTLDDHAYAICLHELGHVHDPITPDQWEHEGDRLKAEVRAWTWATTHAIRWTPAMAEVQQFALRTYLQPRVIVIPILF